MIEKLIPFRDLNNLIEDEHLAVMGISDDHYVLKLTFTLVKDLLNVI
jgi:hypothetical protein